MIRSFLYTTVLAVFSLLLMSQSCEKKQKKDKDEVAAEVSPPVIQKMEMLKYTFTGNYSDLWAQVDSLESDGLYKSALEIVDTIFAAAKADKNAPQIVKSVIFRMKYNSYLEEDDFVNALAELNSLSEKEEFPIKQLIHSVTAEVYWQYYQSHRWEFMNRTQTVNFENNDVRTWDLKTISAHVNTHYLLSLESADSSQHANLNDFNDILERTVTDRALRPTLYDFLAHRAIAFFSNAESELVRPEVKFVIDDKAYFGTASEFIALTPVSETANSNTFQVVKIYQQLTEFRLAEDNHAAFIDLEIKRLSFMRQTSVSSDKDELYLSGLKTLVGAYPENEGSAEVQFYIAQYYTGTGNSYTIEMPENRWDKKKALTICTVAIEQFPDSYGAKLCQQLMENSIEIKTISTENEIAYAKADNGRLKISYKNVDSVYFRLIKVPSDFYANQNYYGSEIVDQLLAKKITKEWNIKLENPGDYQNHSTEILLPKLDYGQYAILVSPTKSFVQKNNIILHDSYWVTDLAYTYSSNVDNSQSVYITDRSSGKPLNRIKVELYERKYNYSISDYEIKLKETLRTDLNGKLTINPKAKYRNFLLQISNGEDQFNTGSDINQGRRSKSKTYTSINTFFFLDRGIYRPGQKIYFKGIKIKRSGEKQTLVTNSSSKVMLYDVNNQKVAELDLKTNEYGTFSGSFTAPNSGLTGTMHIQDKNDSKYFSVEEYKRPKFEVEFAPVEGSFKIGQRIEVKGNAKAYAGSNVDGAEVQFRVTRSSNFNPWTYYRWGYYPQSSPVEIKNGTLKTDENGDFTVEFNALEDPTINKKFSPRYSYEIHADVTDVNGETRSGSQRVSVGYNCLNLNLKIDEVIERSGSNQFIVSTTNLNGQKTPAKGRIQVTKLIEPDQLFRQQFWDRPDLPSISEKEHRSLFPNDVYGNEDEVKNFKKGSRVLTQAFDTEKTDTVIFTDLKSWKPGRYLVETISIDAFDESVEEVLYITILDKSSSKNALSNIWDMTPIKVVCEPGESAEILISTAAEDLTILYEVELRGKIVSKQMIQLSKGQKSIKIPVREEHRGNFTVSFTSIKHGRLNSTKQMIIVPYSNKRLEIAFETFRNKLIPGAPEEWKLIIKGPNGSKVAAELLATMYDASLDEFASNNFSLNPYQTRYSNRYYAAQSFSNSQSRAFNHKWNEFYYAPSRSYDQLNWWGFRGYSGGGLDYYYIDGYLSHGNVSYSYNAPMVQMRGARAESRTDMELDESSAPMDGAFAFSTNQEQQKGLDGGEFKDTERNKNGLGHVKARTNLNETAFFYPQVETNSKGEIILKFTAPEALTRWKFLGLAHSKDLKIGTIQEEIVTQKELMVMPNAPRFFREGDQMTFTAKVSNLAETDLDGTAQLMLFNATNMQPIDAEFKNLNPIVNFTAKKGQSAKLAWDIVVPFGISAVTYRVVAQAGAYTDGEEMALPVLSNRMLVTESMPLPSKGIGTKNFTFNKLINSGTSTSLKHHKLTLEYTSNPAWYAVQAMPYMMEYPHECAEQTFTRYYANSLASSIVNSSPKIKSIFEQWKESDPDAFLSNLEKNQELKSVILEETPWVLDAQNESERKKRIALLFDLNKMDNQLNKALRKLENMQVSNGAWPWFPGMKENRYITQHIVTGMGHLDQLGVKNVREDQKSWKMITKAIGYLDNEVIKDYRRMMKNYPDHPLDNLKVQHIDQTIVQYLYARSYFKDLPMSDNLKEAVDFYQKQANKYWLKFNIYSQGMIALQAKRNGIETLPNKIMASLKERSILHEELGMYWKGNTSGYYWYQAPIETQAMMIEAFDVVTNDQDAVEELKVWLLKQKQTTDWKTTKATAEACYALLLRGTDLLENDEQVVVKVNGKIIDPEDKEAGTGYFKTSWNSEEIIPEMGNVSVTRSTEGVSWGAMYWQYFEDLDKITKHETPLKLKQQLFLVQNTDSGPVITPVEEGTKLKPGDKIRVRIELRTDRNMEYVHMKDMRAAGFEPINVISRYKWQGGLGYYESTGDASTNFFMDFVPKGVYVFEYDLRVSHEGEFSNGITTIQCMYAPEFTSHSEGVRVIVGE